MLYSSFRHSTHLESFSDWPAYVDFVLSLTHRRKTQRYGTVLKFEFLLAQSDLIERERDEIICEVLGYALPSPGEPLPAAYRALKSRAKEYRDEWLAARSGQLQQSQHAAVGCSCGKAA